MNTSPLKIMAISLCSAKKYKAMAVYSGEQLLITNVEPITGMFGSWRGNLVKEIERAQADGFAVIIEEKTDLIARFGTQYLLEDLNDENRSNYFDALDWYFALADLDNIILHTECQQFAIRTGGEGQKVEKKQDEKGRAVYHVNWAAFHGGYRAVLLCVVAAMTEPISERFINEFCGMIGSEIEEELNPVDRFARAMIEDDRKRAREFSDALEKIRRK